MLIYLLILTSCYFNPITGSLETNQQIIETSSLEECSQMKIEIIRERTTNMTAFCMRK